jgi:Family of unknown function (DUF6263)
MRSVPSRVRILVVGCALLASASGVAVDALQQQATLRYRWTTGDTLRYRTTQDVSSVLSGLPGGMPDITLKQTMVQVLTSAIQDVAADGAATMQQTIESMKIEMDTPMGRSGYDSASPASATDPSGTLMKDMLSGLLGQPYTVVISSTGSVQKIEGFSALAEKMFKAVPQNPAGLAITNALKGIFSDESMRNMIGQGFGAMPEKPLKVGDSWNIQTTMKNPMLGGVTTATLCTLTSLEGSGVDQSATIATQLTLKQDPSSPAPPNPMGLTMQMADSAGDGEMLFGVGTGRLIRSTTRTTTPMRMSGSGPDGSALDMKMEVRSVVTVELVN